MSKFQINGARNTVRGSIVNLLCLCYLVFEKEVTREAVPTLRT